MYIRNTAVDHVLTLILKMHKYMIFHGKSIPVLHKESIFQIKGMEIVSTTNVEMELPAILLRPVARITDACVRGAFLEHIAKVGSV